jgi:hypothetical protein
LPQGFFGETLAWLAVSTESDKGGRFLFRKIPSSDIRCKAPFVLSLEVVDPLRKNLLRPLSKRRFWASPDV